MGKKLRLVDYNLHVCNGESGLALVLLLKPLVVVTMHQLKA
ncbi:hypothetical protein [Nodosilinea sp. LEGE 07088]|nr:hypothetical protein [Nodosilinea sp. LEGE 07088]